MEHPAPVQRLIDQFSGLPGIGRKSARRLAYHVLGQPEQVARELAAALIDVKEKIRHCEICSNLSDAPRCTICVDPRRDQSTVCIVEEPSNLHAIERTGGFDGVYHVLMGALSPLRGIGPDDLVVEPLLDRLGRGEIREAILATNPTTEGEATALYLAELMQSFEVRVTRIAQGMPVGSELEYADEVTVARSLAGRREL